MPSNSLKVTPSAVELKAGESQAFEARTEDGGVALPVVWSLTGPGAIDEAKGVYTAPPRIFAARRVTVVAESTTQATGSAGPMRGSASVELNPVRDWIPVLGVYWIAVLAAILLALGLRWSWLCPDCAPQPVLVSPPIVTLTRGQALQFVANADVAWTNTATAGGLYVAPATIEEDQAVTVAATSVVEPRRAGSALVKLSKLGSLSIQPEATTVKAGLSVRITRTMSDADEASFTWLQPSLGKVKEEGPDAVYSAPMDVPRTTVTVLARVNARREPPYSLLAGAHLTIVPSQGGGCECPRQCQVPWRLIVLVALMGALGGLVHGLGSFGTFVGNRELRSSWFWWYFLKPVLASVVAVLVYAVFRAGLGTPDLTVSAWDCWKVSGFAGLIGLFAEPATLKLRDIFETVFTPRRDPRLDKAGERPTPERPEVTSARRADVDKRTVLVTGTGFATGCKVEIDGKAVKVVEGSATSLTVQSDEDLPKGRHTLIVTNPPPTGAASSPFTFDLE